MSAFVSTLLQRSDIQQYPPRVHPHRLGALPRQAQWGERVDFRHGVLHHKFHRHHPARWLTGLCDGRSGHASWADHGRFAQRDVGKRRRAHRGDPRTHQGGLWLFALICDWHRARLYGLTRHLPLPAPKPFSTYHFPPLSTLWLPSAYLLLTLSLPSSALPCPLLPVETKGPQVRRQEAGRQRIALSYPWGPLTSPPPSPPYLSNHSDFPKPATPGSNTPAHTNLSASSPSSSPPSSARSSPTSSSSSACVSSPEG